MKLRKYLVMLGFLGIVSGVVFVANTDDAEAGCQTVWHNGTPGATCQTTYATTCLWADWRNSYDYPCYRQSYSTTYRDGHYVRTVSYGAMHLLDGAGPYWWGAYYRYFGPFPFSLTAHHVASSFTSTEGVNHYGTLSGGHPRHTIGEGCHFNITLNPSYQWCTQSVEWQ